VALRFDQPRIKNARFWVEQALDLDRVFPAVPEVVTFSGDSAPRCSGRGSATGSPPANPPPVSSTPPSPRPPGCPDRSSDSSHRHQHHTRPAAPRWCSRAPPAPRSTMAEHHGSVGSIGLDQRGAREEIAVGPWISHGSWRAACRSSLL
jgi:hypothetical protein